MESEKINQTLSPAVRKIVSENKIDVKSIKGSERWKSSKRGFNQSYGN